MKPVKSSGKRELARRALAFLPMRLYYQVAKNIKKHAASLYVACFFLEPHATTRPLSSSIITW